MEERELAERIKSLQKVLQGQEPASNVILLLETIQKGSAPTEQQLRSTKAGVIIGKLRSNPNKDIARMSSEIISKWKSNISSSKPKKTQSVTNTPTPAPSTPKSVASPLPPSSSYNQPYEGDPEKRHFKFDKVDINRTDDTARNGSIGLFYNGLSYRSTEPIDVVLAKAIECEAAAHKQWKGTGKYATKVRSMFTALKRKDHRKLGLDVMAGTIPAAKFVTMSEQDLASEQQKARDEALQQENLLDAQVAQPEKSVSDALKCGKCGQRKVSYTQAQTRSADEPMTTFCECMNCGNRWKFS